MYNLHVLVTRPDPHGSRLCELIKKHGGVAFHFPTLAFAPAKDPELFQEAVQLLGEQDWLIFISPQAVYESVGTIARVWPHFPPNVQLAAIGGGTANALHEAGYTVSALPPEWNSESLLALSVFQDLAGKKIAIIRGDAGRDYLEKTLKGRGAKVLPVIAYQRILPTGDTAACIQLLQAKHIDVIVCTSFSGVNNLVQLLSPLVKEFPLIVVSERIKSLASDLGFQTIWNAKNASDTAILALLEQLDERR